MRGVTAVLMLWVLLAAPTAAAAAEPGDEIIIGFSGAAAPLPAGLIRLRELGPQTVLARPTDGRDQHAVIAALQNDPTIAYAVPNVQRRLAQQSSDPLRDRQWGLTISGAESAWQRTRGGGVIVAVIDSGVDSGHPEFSGRLLPGFDARNGSSGAFDWNGHGTSVAGIIAAGNNNGIGGSGICPDCRILPIRACDLYGRCDDASVVAGIYYAVDNGARVINLSLGGPGDSTALRAAVAYAGARGVLITAAAGNEGGGAAANYPAAYPDVIAVAAGDRNDQIGQFSNSGNYVSLTAPGVEIVTTLPNLGYGRTSGTSAASPFVAGALALLAAARPELSADDLSCLLLSTVDDLGSVGFDDSYGHGRLNIGRAMAGVDNYAGCPLQGERLSSDDPFTAATVVTSSERYFAETGFTLTGSFRSFWERNGGLAIFGYPISREHRVADAAGRPVTVQYFERHRFEYRPDRDPRFDVLLSRIGADRLQAAGRSWFTEVRSGPQADCRYFAATDQSVCGALLDYWLRGGLEFNGSAGIQADESLVLFGLPLTAAQQELLPDGSMRTVQWFERARLELHDDRVLGGLLGREEAGRP
jgi:thermitase